MPYCLEMLLDLARLCTRHPGLRHLVRGEPRRLVSQGAVIEISAVARKDS